MPPPAVTYRGNGPWGTGQGSNLSAAEIDANIFALASAIVDLQNADPAQPDNIASILVVGTQMTIVLTSGTRIGPLPLPVLSFHLRGEWQPDTSYFDLDLVRVTGTGIFLVAFDHTSASVFDAAATNSNGDLYILLFALDQPPSLEALSDVDIPSGMPDQNDFLVYDIDSTGLGKWVVKDPVQVAAILSPYISGGGGGPDDDITTYAGLTDVDVSGLAPGMVPTWSGSHWVMEQPVVGGGGTISGVDNLVQLGDVDIAGLADGDGLVWNATEAKFVFRKVVLGEPGSHFGVDLYSQLGDVDVSGLAPGMVPTWNGSKWVPEAPSGGGSGGGVDFFSQLGDVEISSNLDDGDLAVFETDSHGGKWNNLSTNGILRRWSPFNFTGQWADGAAYFPFDVALRNGTAWLCFAHVLAPSGASIWEAFSNPGEQATVSTDGLTATFPGVNGEQTVRSTQGRSSGKLVFEVVATDSASGLQIGIVDNAYSAFTSNTAYPGAQDSHGVSTARGGSVYYGGSGGVKSGANNGGGWNSGDRIAVAVDFTNAKIWFRDVTRDAGTPAWYGNNNTGADDPTNASTGFAISTLIGGAPVYPAVACYNAGTAVLYSTDAAIEGALPAGYSSWDGPGNDIPDIDPDHWVSQGSTEPFSPGGSNGGVPGPVPPPGPLDPALGFLSAGGMWEFLPVVIPFYYPGVPANSAIIRASIAYQTTFPSNFAGVAAQAAGTVPGIGGAQYSNNGNSGLAASTGNAGTAATGSTVITVYKVSPSNSKTQIGTITYGAGQVVPTFATQSGAYETVLPGWVIEFDFPGSADATLADPSCALVGYRSA